MIALLCAFIGIVILYGMYIAVLTIIRRAVTGEKD